MAVDRSCFRTRLPRLPPCNGACSRMRPWPCQSAYLGVASSSLVSLVNQLVLQLGSHRHAHSEWANPHRDHSVARLGLFLDRGQPCSPQLGCCSPCAGGRSAQPWSDGSVHRRRRWNKHHHRPVQVSRIVPHVAEPLAKPLPSPTALRSPEPRRRPTSLLRLSPSPTGPSPPTSERSLTLLPSRCSNQPYTLLHASSLTYGQFNARSS